MGKPDPLAAALAEARPTGNNGTVLKIDQFFADRPAVQEEIIAAYKRGLGFSTIANVISKIEPDCRVGDSAVKSWLRAKGAL